MDIDRAETHQVCTRSRRAWRSHTRAAGWHALRATNNEYEVQDNLPDDVSSAKGVPMETSAPKHEERAIRTPFAAHITPHALYHFCSPLAVRAKGVPPPDQPSNIGSVRSISIGTTLNPSYHCALDHTQSSGR